MTATFIVCLKYSCLRTALILQVVLAPVLVGAWMQTFFPQVVARITHVAPLIAVLVSSLLASRCAPPFYPSSVNLLYAQLHMLDPAMILDASCL